MTNYVDEKHRRIEQFAQYLRLMGLRRHKVVKDDCFIVFNESDPEDADAPHIKESVAIKVDCLANGGSTSGGEAPCEMPPSDWSGPTGTPPLSPAPRSMATNTGSLCNYMPARGSYTASTEQTSDQ